METLMELVNSCEKFKHDKYLKHSKNADMAEKLKSLGFTNAANELLGRSDVKKRLSLIADYDYITVTDKKIQKFLDAKAKRYNEEHKDDCEHSRILFQNLRQQLAGTLSARPAFATEVMWSGNIPLDGIRNSYRTFSADTIHRELAEDGTIGFYAWLEVPVKDYGSIPPQDVLDTMEEHKKRGIFDEFSVASVKGIHDPLLLGRLSGHPDRWFIAQWGDDVQIDDLI